MKKAIIPTENVQEPNEEARQPVCDKVMSHQLKSNKIHRHVNFDETNKECSENTVSQNSNSYKEALSQPGPGLTQRQRLQWLQKRRNTGLWVQCDDCDRWRHLPHIIDSHELPKKWYCKMNPDTNMANCSAPEVPINFRDEEDLIYSEYSAGSVVWAKMSGWPWWPAMVDDCPDNEQFYWLDGFSDIPTHYNVAFFDTFDVTRAWIAPDHMKPYGANKKAFNNMTKDKRYKSRLEVAVHQADDADMLPLADRLAKYSFIARYKGGILRPKKINKQLIGKFKKQLKRKYNIDFSEDSASESDDCPKENDLLNKTVRKNVIILGSPKKKAPKKIDGNYWNDNVNMTPTVLTENMQEKACVEEAANNDIIHTNNKVSLEPYSMAVQIGSSEVKHDSPIGNNESPVLIQEKELSTLLVSQEASSHIFETRIASPSSADFDF